MFMEASTEFTLLPLPYEPLMDASFVTNNNHPTLNMKFEEVCGCVLLRDIDVLTTAHHIPCCKSTIQHANVVAVDGQQMQYISDKVSVCAALRSKSEPVTIAFVSLENVIIKVFILT